MTEEHQLLASIQEKPEDSAARLVYADWLEEQGSNLGELIRIKQEMRLLPIYSDEYWERKPRRNQLREEAPAS